MGSLQAADVKTSTKLFHDVEESPGTENISHKLMSTSRHGILNAQA